MSNWFAAKELALSLDATKTTIFAAVSIRYKGKYTEEWANTKFLGIYKLLTTLTGKHYCTNDSEVKCSTLCSSTTVSHYQYSHIETNLLGLLSLDNEVWGNFLW
jgi:hypothetical protein